MAAGQRVASLVAVAAYLGNALARVAGPLLWLHGAVAKVFLLAPMIVVALVAFSSTPYLSFPPQDIPGVGWAYFADGNWLRVSATGSPRLERNSFCGRRTLWLPVVSPMILPHIVICIGLFFTFVAIRLNGHPARFWITYIIIRAFASQLYFAAAVTTDA